MFSLVGFANILQYGVIKKIEHFWKGLSHDKTQISALPPEQYGDRFYNFIEGITMSPEATLRQAQERDQENARASTDRLSRNPGHKSSQDIPPMPTHQPPIPPIGRVASPEGRETVEMASQAAQKTERQGASEEQVPARTLRTLATTSIDGEESFGESVLPIVEQTGAGAHHHSNQRPFALSTNKPLPPTRAPPPTPPKPQNLFMPESVDHGPAVANNGKGTMKLLHKFSRESLNKTLPPPPKQDETEDSGVNIAT